MYKTTKHLSCAETAKLIRAALKESFPSVKFTVKSKVYAGGSSIDVSYVDGPTSEQVKSVVSLFEGKYFDGMTDYKGFNYSSLDGEQVSFGADFVFVSRKFSFEYLDSVVTEAAKKFGCKKPFVRDCSYGAYVERDYTNDMHVFILKEVEKASQTKTNESNTLSRVLFLGDDGYGYNSVGFKAA